MFRPTTNDYYFFSYAHAEFTFAYSLVLSLLAANIDLWFDYQDIQPGDAWHSAILDAVKQSKGLILLASRTSLKSEFVRKEITTARKNNKKILVVLFEPLRLSEEFKNDEIIRLDGNFAKMTGKAIHAIQNPSLKISTPTHYFARRVRYFELIPSLIAYSTILHTVFWVTFLVGSSIGVVLRRVALDFRSNSL